MLRANSNKPERWKTDIQRSVDHFNNWFLACAPVAFRSQREITARKVEAAFEATEALRNLSPDIVAGQPSIVQTLRMATCPPIARDRLSGLADLPASMLDNMEGKNRLPPRADEDELDEQLRRLCKMITQLLDTDIFPWLDDDRTPLAEERERASYIVADRLTGAIANPIIRNAQERRQLEVISEYLCSRGYTELELEERPGDPMASMSPGTFAFRLGVCGQTRDGSEVNIPVDVVIKPPDAASGDMPVLVEAKSAGDFTNVNKRRKEEAIKAQQLRARHGEHVRLLLFLCGYFDSTYLGYEAAEGLDWVWEHRIGDFQDIGL